MLKGDLAATTVSDVLRELAEGAATGCLHVVDPAGETAKAYLRGGRVYAVIVPGNTPALGARLVSSGALGPEALAEALEAQRTELQGWRLGELLVHLGYVDQPVVEDFVNEQVRESLSLLLPWRSGTWKFRVNERTREDVAPPVPVAELLAEIESRRSTWATIEQTVHGPDAVPVLSAAGTADSDIEVDADAWSLLCKVDGTRTITDLARECGFTLYEAGRVVYILVGAGLLEVEDDEVEQAEPVLPDLVPADVASRLVSALSGASSQSDVTVEDYLELTRGLEAPDDDEVSGSISRVSKALSALLGPATAGDDIFNTPMHRAKPEPPVAPEDPKKAERTRREAVRRERDAAELASAQAELEAARVAEQVRRDDLLPAGHVADVVDLHTVREAARLEDERLEAARLEAARLEAEALEAEAAKTARLEAEAADAARLEAEAAAAEAAETARLEAEAAEAAETARVEAEAAEAARLEAETAEAARLEQERLDAETARLEAEAAEAARLEAEAAETARVKAEAAETARLEAETAEAARLEQERLDAETARLEAEAAESARQAQAAEQARVEAENARLAQERADAEAHALAVAQAELAQAELAQAQLAQAEADAEQQRLLQDAARAEFAEASRLEEERAEQQRIIEAVAKAEAEAAAAEFAAFAADQAADESATAMDREAQAAAFAELSASASMDVPEPEPAVAASVPQEAMWDDEPMPTYASHDTDTASLLRELSSLGLDDDPAPAPTSRPSPPRPVTLQAQKKKKGLFGRG